MARDLAAVLLCAALLTACDDTGTGPLPLPAAGYNFTNAPAELPNVLRSGGRVISAFFDLEQDMLVVAGAPEDPRTDRLCGGTELRQFIPVQWVGDLEDLVKQLAMLDAINILVYQPVPAGPCSLRPSDNFVTSGAAPRKRRRPSLCLRQFITRRQQ